MATTREVSRVETREVLEARIGASLMAPSSRDKAQNGGL